MDTQVANQLCRDFSPLATWLYELPILLTVQAEKKTIMYIKLIRQGVLKAEDNKCLQQLEGYRETN